MFTSSLYFSVLFGILTYTLSRIYFEERVQSGGLSLRAIRWGTLFAQAFFTLVLGIAFLVHFYKQPGLKVFENLGDVTEQMDDLFIVVLGVPYIGFLTVIACVLLRMIMELIDLIFKLIAYSDNKTHVD